MLKTMPLPVKNVLLLLSLLAITLSSCSKPGNQPKPVAELIRRVWVVNVARENGTTVYSKTGTNNLKPAYSSFRLDLSNTQQKTARLTFIDGTTSAGTWELSSDNKTLTLSGLTPQPTTGASGTAGSISFTINNTPTATTLSLTRTTPDPKSGNTANEYELIPV